jgi:cob(I)alamin adenosyltransferase
MGSSIYTRTGDRGETSLVDGTRVPKRSDRVEAYGTVDEACSAVGAARAFAEDPLLDRALEFLQHRLYNGSSNLAVPPGATVEPPRVGDDDVAFLESAIDRFEETTGRVDRFVVPGGCRSAALLHVARTVCRRAERRVLRLAAAEPVDPFLVRFLNRASDFLFAAARYANHRHGCGDVAWNRELSPPDLGPGPSGA